MLELSGRRSRVERRTELMATRTVETSGEAETAAAGERSRRRSGRATSCCCRASSGPEDRVRARPRARPRRRPETSHQPDVHADPGISRRPRRRCITSISIGWTPREVDDLGLDELTRDGVVAIEWPDRWPIRRRLATTCTIEHQAANRRADAIAR